MAMVMEKVAVTKTVREAYAMQQLITAREEEIDAMLESMCRIIKSIVYLRLNIMFCV